MKNSKSGTIPVKFVKHVRNEISPPLAVLFNKCFSLSTFPENLKIVCLCTICKGEGTRSNPDNYRTILILPVVARIFEKLIHEDRPLSSLIFKVFKLDLGKKNSTSTFLLETTDNWFLNTEKGEYNIAVFLDLRKAFNTVNHEVMLYKLFLYGDRGIELKWVSS